MEYHLPCVRIYIRAQRHNPLQYSGCGEKPRERLSKLGSNGIFNILLLKGCEVILQGIYKSFLFSWYLCLVL